MKKRGNEVMCCRQLTTATVVSGALLFAPALSLSADMLVRTTDGKEYLGEVIAAGVNTLTVKLKETGYGIVPVQSIDRVRVDIDNGTPIEGRFLDWSDGEIIVRVGDRDVAIRGGTVISVTEVGVAAGGPKLTEEPEVPSNESAPQLQTPAPDSSEPGTPERAPTNATM